MHMYTKRYGRGFAAAAMISILCPAFAAAQVPNGFGPIGLTVPQTLRLNVTAGPGGCIAALTFINSVGQPPGPPSNVRLGPGQTGSLDLLGSLALASGQQRAEFTPIITPNDPAGGGADCTGTAEVFDTSTGFGHAYYNTGQPGTVGLSPQWGGIVVGVGQILRLNIAAAAPSSCSAVVGFVDPDGQTIGPPRIGPPREVSLAPGVATYVSAPGGRLVTNLGDTFVVLPAVQINGGTCQVSAEVYYQTTGATLVAPGRTN